MLIKFDVDLVDLDEIFCCFVFAAFANAGVDAESSSPCLKAFAKVSASLLFVPSLELSLIVFASGSALLAFAFAALPNVVGGGVGVLVGAFALVGDEVIGARVGSVVGSGTGERVGLFVGDEVGGSWMETIGLFVGEVGGSVAATGEGVGFFVGAEVGGSVVATGAGVGLCVGEVVGGSVAATGDVVGDTVAVFVGDKVGIVDDATGQNA